MQSGGLFNLVKVRVYHHLYGWRCYLVTRPRLLTSGTIRPKLAVAVNRRSPSTSIEGHSYVRHLAQDVYRL